MTGLAHAPAASGPLGTPSEPRRLAIFTSHPIQYQAPFFRALAGVEGVMPTVFFGSRHGADVAMDGGFGTAFRWDVPLLEGYAHAFLPNEARRPDVSRFTGVRVGGTGQALAAGPFDALLLLGWQTLAHVQALRAAWRNGIPVIVRGESTLQRPSGAGTRALARRVAWLPARRMIYGAAFARVDAFLVIGSRNREYYRSFGVPDERMFWAPYGVDNDWFALPEPARSVARAKVRARIGAGPDSVVFASSAKLIERKRPLDLVAAVGALRGGGVDARALFIGDGPERDAIERAARAAGIGPAVSIAGFINQRELPEWYAAADALVLPSDARETWGLVVNEAMAAGLPVVVSDAAGCAPDLVRENENGFTYPCGDVAALADRLARVSRAGSGGRRELGERSRHLVEGFSIAVATRATVAALEAVVRRAPRSRAR